MVDRDLNEMGAEARVFISGDVVVKERVNKGYRHEELDKKLVKERTEREARHLKKARKGGVNTPEIDCVEGNTIKLEFIDGEKFRDVFEKRDDLWKDFGKNIARLHAQNIIHGDLTTSNVIVKEDQLFFIDFGLSFSSERLEDRATDLRLMKQVLDGTHHRVSEEAFNKILEGYSEIGDREAVEERLEEMIGRTRYN